MSTSRWSVNVVMLIVKWLCLPAVNRRNRFPQNFDDQIQTRYRPFCHSPPSDYARRVRLSWWPSNPPAVAAFRGAAALFPRIQSAAVMSFDEKDDYFPDSASDSENPRIFLPLWHPTKSHTIILQLKGIPTSTSWRSIRTNSQTAILSTIALVPSKSMPRSKLVELRIDLYGKIDILKVDNL
jgi:hypothetical protein